MSKESIAFARKQIHIHEREIAEWIKHRIKVAVTDIKYINDRITYHKNKIAQYKHQLGI
jgi:uncharacterized Fe-S radical SAM superfamily protein PflX